MSTAELKSKLIQKINATSDEQLLLDVTRLFEIRLLEEESIFELSRDMRQAVNEAREQIKRGEYLSHEDANQEINKWLGE